jgi:hypothetical protein
MSHIPGARSIPLAELRRRLPNCLCTEVVALAGDHGVMTIDAVGYCARGRAHRMELGVADWHARGWRIERGA